MSSQVTLSAGVRQNLLALQNTAALLATTQGRLATGKKVNSALDNPSNFFTSQSLSNRASDLSALLDSIGQAQQTLSAANQGTVTYTTIAGTQAIAADTTRLTSTGTVASAVSGVVASVQSSATINAAGIAALANNDTLTYKLGSGATYT